MSKQKNDRTRSAVRAGCAALGYVGALAACSGDVINLGERENELAAPPYSRCQSSSTLDGPVRVESQEQLDALEGCEVIAGDLDIVAFPSASLRSLHALRSVEGYVVVGGHPPVRPDDGRSLEEWLDELGAYQNSLVDWLPSLEGLEHLETVDSLALTAPVSSLLPLSGLRRINTGLLKVESNVLSSLAGLDDIRGFDSLHLAGAELRDISAVRLPETLENLLIHAPIAALNANQLRSADTIDLAGTELASLDALENLEQVGTLSVVGNHRLRELGGLDAVRNIGDLHVQENDALERLCDFTSLSALERLLIQDNDNLTELPSFPAYYAGDLTPATDRPFVNVEHLELRGNLRLRRLPIPAAWKAANVIIVSGTHLDSIDFVNLQSVGTLVITTNASLRDVQLGALSSAAYLEVRENRELAPTAFDLVRSFESHIDDNAPRP